MRLNVIAAYVLDRQYLERRGYNKIFFLFWIHSYHADPSIWYLLGAVEASRLRYKQFVEDNRRDSASEPDDELPGQNSTVSLGPLQEERKIANL